MERIGVMACDDESERREKVSKACKSTVAQPKTQGKKDTRTRRELKTYSSGSTSAHLFKSTRDDFRERNGARFNFVAETFRDVNNRFRGNRTW